MNSEGLGHVVSGESLLSSDADDPRLSPPCSSLPPHPLYRLHSINSAIQWHSEELFHGTFDPGHNWRGCVVNGDVMFCVRIKYCWRFFQINYCFRIIHIRIKRLMIVLNINNVSLIILFPRRVTIFQDIIFTYYNNGLFIHSTAPCQSLPCQWSLPPSLFSLHFASSTVFRSTHVIAQLINSIIGNYWWASVLGSSSVLTNAHRFAGTNSDHVIARGFFYVLLFS